MTTPVGLAIDDNLVARDGGVFCRHCQARVGSSGLQDDYLHEAIIRERPTSALGDALIRAEPSYFTDQAVTMRQAFCPGCKTLLLTETLLADESFRRVRRLSRATMKHTS